MESKIEKIISKQLRELSLRIDDQEQKIKSLNFDVGGMSDEMKHLKQVNESLLQKVDDLENRSRRNNLVLFGIEETQQKEDCYKTVGDFLSFIGREEDKNCIERCHRTPTFQPPQKDAAHSKPRPRKIHIAFSSFVVKEKVRKAAIEKLKNTKSIYHDQAVYVAEDLSKRVIQLRKNKSQLFRRLKVEGKRPFFAFPDKLCYRDEAGKLKIVN